MPSGFVTVASAGPDPSVTKDRALVQSLPGRTINWDVAPALRCVGLDCLGKGKVVGCTHNCGHGCLDGVFPG